MDPLRICAVEYPTHALTDQSTAPAHSPTLRGHAHVNLSFAVPAEIHPERILHHPVVNLESGPNYLKPHEAAVRGRLGAPYVIVLEGSITDRLSAVEAEVRELRRLIHPHSLNEPPTRRANPTS